MFGERLTAVASEFSVSSVGLNLSFWSWAYLLIILIQGTLFVCFFLFGPFHMNQTQHWLLRILWDLGIKM